MVVFIISLLTIIYHHQSFPAAFGCWMKRPAAGTARPTGHKAKGRRLRGMSDVHLATSGACRGRLVVADGLSWFMLAQNSWFETMNVMVGKDCCYVGLQHLITNSSGWYLGMTWPSRRDGILPSHSWVHDNLATSTSRWHMSSLLAWGKWIGVPFLVQSHPNVYRL